MGMASLSIVERSIESKCFVDIGLIVMRSSKSKSMPLEANSVRYPEVSLAK